MAEEYAHIYGLKETVAALKLLPRELGSKGGGPIRAALATASAVMRDAVQRAAPVLTGNLTANVYMWRDRNPNTSGNTERYTVSIRVGRKRYSRTRINERLRRVGRFYATRGNAWYWWLLEFGFNHIGGKHVRKEFMRPTFERMKYQSVEAFRLKLIDSVGRAVATARAKAGA